MNKRFNNISKILITLLAICISLTGCVSTYDTQNSTYSTEIMQSDITNIYESKNIALPCDSYSCDGKQYADVVAQFENAGFTNVKVIEQQGDQAKETRINGSVIAVTVNDNIIFSQGEIIDSNSEIKIYYVVSLISQTTPTQQNENASSTISETQSESSTIEKEQSAGITPNTNQSSQKSESESDTETQNETISSAENSSYMVWISENGKRYHNKATCSGMKSPKQVSKEYAEDEGYEPCKRCYK